MSGRKMKGKLKKVPAESEPSTSTSQPSTSSYQPDDPSTIDTNIPSEVRSSGHKRKKSGDEGSRKKQLSDPVTSVSQIHDILFAESEDDLEHDSSSDTEGEGEEQPPAEGNICPSPTPEVSTDAGDPPQVERSDPPDVERTHQRRQWYNEPPIEREQIPFTGNKSLNILPDTLDPIGFFTLLFSLEFMQKIVNEINSYAVEILATTEGVHSRISRWKDITVEEFRIFLAIYFHMGVIRLNRIADYWKTDYRFNLPFFQTFMPRNRYQILLRALHFCNNEDDDGSDNIFKIRPIFEYFNNRMTEVYSPGKELSLDESMVLWRGRLKFRQYIKNKRHKYGFKLYVLAEPDGLVQRLVLYGGVDDQIVGGKRHADKVVGQLLSGKEGKGHSLYMDSYYNSVTLAETLLDKKTYCTGTLQSNRQGNPVEVVKKKLQKGEVTSKYTSEGICVSKWKDKRDVLAISSEFSGDLVQVRNKRGFITQKPELIVEYNKNMKGVDRQDQMLSYYPSCHKTLRWYKKLGLHIFQILLINANFLYNSYRGTQQYLNTYDFRLAVIESLVGGPPEIQRPKPTDSIHLPKFLPKDDKGKTMRRRCKLCWDTTGKRVNTLFYCQQCPTEPGLCLDPCFQKFHEY